MKTFTHISHAAIQTQNRFQFCCAFRANQNYMPSQKNETRPLPSIIFNTYLFIFIHLFVSIVIYLFIYLF